MRNIGHYTFRVKSEVTFGVKYGLTVVSEKPLHAVSINYIEKQQWVNVVSGQLFSEVITAYISFTDFRENFFY